MHIQRVPLDINKSHCSYFVINISTYSRYRSLKIHTYITTTSFKKHKRQHTDIKKRKFI